MRKVTAVIVLGVAAVLLAACCCPTGIWTSRRVRGSGVLVTQEMSYADFSGLEVGSAFTVDVTRADSYRVEITVDDNLVDYLGIYKRGSTLHIGTKPLMSISNVTLRARITMPELDELDLSGATRGSISGFRSSAGFSLSLSGASSLTGDLSRTADVRFELSGASSVTLRGAVRNLTLELSGASRANLADLTVNDADVELSGASTATVNVSGRLDADLSGASTLEYLGNPTLGKITQSGGSRIRAK